MQGSHRHSHWVTVCGSSSNTITPKLKQVLGALLSDRYSWKQERNGLAKPLNMSSKVQYFSVFGSAQTSPLCPSLVMLYVEALTFDG